MNKRLVPKLRFPEFDGEWRSCKFGDVGKFIGGGTPSTKNDSYWIGDIPWISSSDLVEGDIHSINAKRFITRDAVDNSATKLIPQGSVLIVSRVGVGKVAINKFPLCTSQDFQNVILDLSNEVFIAYLVQLKASKLIEFNQGTSIKGFVKEDLINLVLALPILPEQTKIADFLTAVDDKIQQLTRKKELLEQYKKGVMQQLFSQKIRFKDDDGDYYPDWDYLELEELLKYEQPTKYIVNNTDYSDEFLTPVLTAGKTFILGYTNEVDGIFKEKLPVIIFDDFTTSNQYVDFEFKVKSSAMKILLPINEYVNIKYVYERLQFIDFALGDEHKRYWISEFSKEVIEVPCLKEQTKIADFLASVDDGINKLSLQLQQTKTYKNSLLQQMFI